MEKGVVFCVCVGVGVGVRVVCACAWPLPRSGRGHLGCLVAVDHCSKWAVAVPLRSKSSAAVAGAFHHRVLPALLKVPQRVLSDNGPEFRGSEFESVLNDWKIQHAYSTPYHPEGNGAVERCNRTIGQSLRLLTTYRR